MTRLFETLRIQRWDDHRYYHHSRINQSLHLVSALSFLTAYAFLFIDPVVASIIAWVIAMTTRQIGHFFFEPKGYDMVNQATHAHKEDIKVGYNLQRKIVLLSIWAAIPVIALIWPEGIRWMVPQAYEDTSLRMIGMAWLFLGISGLIFRAAQLMVKDDMMTAVAWLLKIVSDPFHDLKLYHRAPLYLLRGELIDPMAQVRRL
jgi:hypothetical protein